MQLSPKIKNGVNDMNNSISIAYIGWRWFSFTMRYSKVNLQCTNL